MHDTKTFKSNYWTKI